MPPSSCAGLGGRSWMAGILWACIGAPTGRLALANSAVIRLVANSLRNCVCYGRAVERTEFMLHNLTVNCDQRPPEKRRVIKVRNRGTRHKSDAIMLV